MPVKAVYASGVLAVYVRGEELDQLLDVRAMRFDLSLNGVTLVPEGVDVGLTQGCADFLKNVVQIEREAFKEQARLVEHNTPGYSNKRIRKGK